ncbi:isochorismatase [Klebsiella pneumoniae]|uniref:Isochorismatase n=1 Tax=Klebsiella pneumoniae TaxID=573 RepID=A0A3S4HXZ7_KLEPN|nr:isochorismatase [Klebsiella pneumoniae]
MTAQRVVMVVDMQNGVFATPRLARERCVAQINRLVRAADRVIFIQHDEAGGLEAGSEGFALLPELEQPAGALYVTKTACDAFYHTSLAQVLDEHDIQQFVICGCATDYCLDTTIKKWRQPRVRYCYRGRCPHHRRPPRRAGRDAYRPLQ